MNPLNAPQTISEIAGILFALYVDNPTRGTGSRIRDCRNLAEKIYHYGAKDIAESEVCAKQHELEWREFKKEKNYFVLRMAAILFNVDPHYATPNARLRHALGAVFNLMLDREQ